MWYIYTMEYYLAIHEIHRQMDGTGKYHPEWDKPITKEHTWYILTDKWIWNSRRRKTTVWILWSFLEGGTNYPWKELQRRSMEQKLKVWPYRDCPIWGYIPYIVTKSRHYCGCQQVLAERSLIELSLERLYQCLTNTEVDACSHSVDWAQGTQLRS